MKVTIDTYEITHYNYPSNNGEAVVKRHPRHDEYIVLEVSPTISLTFSKTQLTKVLEIL